MFVYFKKIAALMRALVDGAQVDWLEREAITHKKTPARIIHPAGAYINLIA